MKLWERTPGYWLFWISAVYFFIGMYCVANQTTTPVVLVQLIWLIFLMLPFLVPPLGRWLNVNITWDRKMLEWFNKKEVPKYVPEGMTKPKPDQKDERSGQTVYSVGLTDNNRVSVRVGYNEFTMNSQGVQQLIDQLELFKQQIAVYEVQPEERVHETQD